jgi:hypothetical protein
LHRDRAQLHAARRPPLRRHGGCGLWAAAAVHSQREPQTTIRFSISRARAHQACIAGTS